MKYSILNPSNNKIMKKISAGILFLLFFALAACDRTNQTAVIIPQPVEISMSKGHITLHKSDNISYVGGEQAGEVAKYLGKVLRPATGFAFEAHQGSDGNLLLVLDTTLSWQPEQYRLRITGKRITLTGCTPAGLSRGVQTIRQLLPCQIERDSVVKDIKWIVPCLEINDYPRFAWRGMHLDVSRHFFDIEFIKKYIDLIALHKMNTFHWHLVDDQGWRIEIKKYPRLTEVGAWRVDREDKPWNSRQPQQPGEKATYGGYYTQEEIKEVVAYAAERHINIVPEIEMPAHVGSAMAAYPEYSCTGGPFTVPPGGVWPITDIYCAGKEETFKFLEDVLTEVMELFPSPYIHIGGDEADKTEWKKCPLCQKRIRAEGLKDEAELQSYFIKRIEKFLNSKGRKLVGWNEILEGGLAPGAVVMSWRGFEGGIAAAKSGHEVVMTPTSHCYFNVYQGDAADEPEAFSGYLSLKKVYSFEPVPSGLTDEEAKFIIGGQGDLWTEMVRDGSRAEYMVLPRMTALSEVLWSPRESRDWQRFNTNLTSMTRRFDVMGLNYSKGTYKVEMSPSFDMVTNSVSISLLSEQLSPDIRYTIDGSEPTAGSPKYSSPIIISAPATLKAAVFEDGKMIGNVSEKAVNINKATGKKVTYKTAYQSKYQASGDITLVDGICGSLYFNDGYWQGFEGDDMDVIIDLGKENSFKKIVAEFIASTGSWIFLPQWVEFSASPDGNIFTPLGRTENKTRPEDQGTMKQQLAWTGGEVNARFIHVLAKNLGVCPSWHAGAGGKAWLFADEIIVE